MRARRVVAVGRPRLVDGRSLGLALRRGLGLGLGLALGRWLRSAGGAGASGAVSAGSVPGSNSSVDEPRITWCSGASLERTHTAPSTAPATASTTATTRAASAHGRLRNGRRGRRMRPAQGTRRSRRLGGVASWVMQLSQLTDARPAAMLVALGLLVASAVSFVVTQGEKLVRGPIAGASVSRILAPSCDCPNDVALAVFQLREADTGHRRDRRRGGKPGAHAAPGRTGRAGACRA